MSETDPRLTEAQSHLDHRPALAERLADELIESGVETQNAMLCKGLAIGNRGEFQRAAQYLFEVGTSPEFFVNAAHYFQRAGEEQEEIKALLRLLDYPRRDHEQSFRRLAAWAVEKKQWHVAREALFAVFDQNSGDLNILLSLANACRELRLPQQALTFNIRALDMLPESAREEQAGVHAALAGIYKDMGEQQRALHHFRQVHELSPSTNSSSNLIMDMQYTHGVDLQEFYDQCRDFSQRFLRAMPRFQYPLERLDAGRAQQGLRIGFVSGDFIAHSLTNLMLEPFQRFKAISPHHTFICYFTRDTEDQWSERYKGCVDIWRSLHGKNALERAQIMHGDDLDILIDLAGHTAHNALPSFGYKPAPVQMGWISGMMTPPAIETIHYFFTDPYIRPDQADQVCSERLINLPSTCTYFPMSDPPEVGDLPADRQGHLTFGSFNNPCKISDPVLSVWTACLRAVSNSHMHIKVYNRDHEREIARKMERAGIARSRLTFIRSLPSQTDVMRYITNNFDLALDTWPCAGMLTSAEIMWMGVPVMTMSGGTFLHNQTHTLNCQCRLEEELSANTDAQFVEKVRTICGKRERLREIRRTLRELMGLAPVRDPLAVAQAIIGGCEWAWQDWCTSRRPLERLSLYGKLPRAIV